MKQISPRDKAVLIRRCIESRQKWAVDFAIRVLDENKPKPAPHNEIICKTLDRVISGEIKRLLINIPPGYGKTLTAVWAFIIRGLMVNPKSRYIHASYSQELALDNSSKVKEIIASEAYQAMMPMALRDDTSAKGLWRNQYGGGMRAAQAGGSITGFRAGLMEEGFTGALIVDDPTKPDDTTSRKKTSAVNHRYNGTLKSRLANEDVPIIVIMQRLAAFTGEFNDAESLKDCGDMSEFLLRGGSGENWHHLLLPVEIDNSLEYPEEWTHGIEIEHGLPDGPLWEYKHDSEAIEVLHKSDKYTTAAQYYQRPKKRTGDPIIDGEWFNYYTEAPPLRKIEIYADTASKTGESNDFSVLLAAGVCHEGDLYLIDLLRGKWTIPELYKQAMEFWETWKANGATRFCVEDANSGTYLMQAMGEKIGKSVVGIPRHRDKFTRVSGIVERISSGRVYLPKGAPWVQKLVDECEEFTDNDTHAYDDMVDTLTDALETLVPVKKKPRISFGMQA